MTRKTEEVEIISREMGRAARRFAEGFSWDASAEAFEGVLNRVVADSSTR